MSRTMPTLDLVREVTDRAVLGELFAHQELTRADIAARTALSKPTVSESMRRLESAGLVTDAGAAVGGRGRAGRNYRLADGAGSALALSAGPDGVLAVAVDLYGQVVARAQELVPGTLAAEHLGPAIRRVASDVLEAAAAPVRATSVSVAGPFDQIAGRVVHLPDSPFVTDEFDPSAALAGLALGELSVDNDVNWAALGEVGQAAGDDAVLYAYLGAGIGACLISGGQVQRGHRGLAGELAQITTEGPAGRAMRLVRVWQELELTQPGSPAIDIDRTRQALAAGGSTADAIVRAVGGALATAAALLNPARIVLAGPWHDGDSLLDRVAEVVAQGPVAAHVGAAVSAADPLGGARADALTRSRALVLAD